MSEFTTINSTNLFSEYFLKFQSTNINVEHIPIPIPIPITEITSTSSTSLENENENENIICLEPANTKFGILNFKTIMTSLTEQEQDIIFMIDCSGSMSDTCNDGRSKMQHIIHTLKNMIMYFKENSNIKAHVTIYCFDDRIYNTLERSSITNENYAEIISKVDNIIPRDNTNIELALLKVKEYINKIKNDYPNTNISHIFMTDGQITIGNSNAETLSELVDTTVTNAFIGFGIEHDSNLLETISSGEKSNYYFIDKLENSGLVYGEILHDIVYKFLTNVKLTINNGLVYNFKKNIWVPTLNIGEIVSESNKIYHIVSSNETNCFVTINGTIYNQNFEFIIWSVKETEDLTKYIYRQRTLQHLYIVRNDVGRLNNFYQSHYEKDKHNILKSQIKKNMFAFFQEMKKYMEDNNLTNDSFMKNLCDDIYICYKTFDKTYASMYISARHSSQGAQRYYTVSETPQDITNNFNGFDGFDGFDASDELDKDISFTPMKRLKRHKVNNYFNNMGNNSNTNNTNNTNNIDDIDGYQVSNFNDTPYLTPSSTQLMREISNTQNIFTELKIKEKEN